MSTPAQRAYNQKLRRKDTQQSCQKTSGDYACTREVSHNSPHMAITQPGELLAVWGWPHGEYCPGKDCGHEEGIASIDDMPYGEDMTDTKKAAVERVTVDEMITRVGIRQAYQWLAVLFNPTYATDQMMQWIQSDRDPKTPQYPAYAVAPAAPNPFANH